MLNQSTSRPSRWRVLNKVAVWASLTINLVIVAGVIALFVQFTSAQDSSSPIKVNDIGCPHGLAEDMSTGRCKPDGKVSATSYISERIRSAISSPELRETYKVASWGGVHAQRTLALAYMIGQGVEINNKHSFYWLRKAAVQGDSTSQYILSVMLAKGVGAPKDNLEAIRWLKESALGNDADAQAIYGEVLLKGNVVKRNRKEGLEWLERAKRNRAKRNRAKQRLLKPTGA